MYLFKRALSDSFDEDPQSRMSQNRQKAELDGLGRLNKESTEMGSITNDCSPAIERTGQLLRANSFLAGQGSG